MCRPTFGSCKRMPRLVVTVIYVSAISESTFLPKWGAYVKLVAARVTYVASLAGFDVSGSEFGDPRIMRATSFLVDLFNTPSSDPPSTPPPLSKPTKLNRDTIKPT